MAVRTVSVNVFCRDLTRVFAFYRDLFDLVEIDARRSPIYRALHAGAIDLGFHAPDAVSLLNADHLRVEQPTVTHYPTFHVDDYEQVSSIARSAVTLGGGMLKAPYITYYRAYQAVLQDPEGNFFRVNFDLPLEDLQPCPQ